MKPTKQQQAILDYTGNTVVIAAPGSGKTFVISTKIREIFSDLLDHQGVIAISYTNKASQELRSRCLKNGVNPKSSFFGTIDRFFISEIIVPFGKQVFGIPDNDLKVLKLQVQDVEVINKFPWVSRDTTLEHLTDKRIEKLKNNFLSGTIWLETTGVLANYIYTKSLACRNYLKARYKYIFIDEYQDSGQNQHEIFLKINALGITGIAVGDLNQSIYAFSGKSSFFLSSLRQRDDFKHFVLNKNHRCHQSIIDYSNYLLDHEIDILEKDDRRVFFKKINGKEIEIAQYIDSIIDGVKKRFSVSNNSDIAILARGNTTISIIDKYLQTPHHVSNTTELDQSLNTWATVFSLLLKFVHDKSFRFIEIIEEFTSYDRLTKDEVNELQKLKHTTMECFAADVLNVKEIIRLFKKIATIIAPNAINEESVTLLKDVLLDPALLSSYKPVSKNEINIYTIHKSKGLEFDVVFHLDINEFVLPAKQPGPNNDWDNLVYSDWVQDLNLHYVALTRARKACIMLNSTKRTNSNFEERNAKDSEFLSLNGIDKLRYKKKG